MSDCVFCDKLAEGSVTNFGPTTAHFEPLNPVTPGHRLFIPKIHAGHRDGIAASVVLANAMQSASIYGQEQDEDFNLITSSGASATQTIPHIHVHYVPRRDGDGLALPWTEQQKEEQL